jgi:3-oxoacyl-[acyl-carrier protein] reductase
VAGTGAIHFLPFDFANLDEIPALFAALRERHGPIYGLVNNAGIGTEGVLATMEASKIEALVRINTIAPLIVTKHAVRSMMSAGSGRIVNISSIIASTGYSGLSVYAATKASLIGFTKSLAREVGTLGITVNAVAPGFVETSMTGGMDDAHRATIARRSALKRLPDVADVVHAVDYLMSDKARNVTGTVLTVDAGNTA